MSDTAVAPKRRSLVEIRPLTVADAETFRAMRLEALRDSPEAFHTSAEELAATPREVFEEQLRQADGDGDVVLGAFDGGLIGITGCRRHARQKLRHKADIWGVYVTPAARRRGVARRLLEAALAYARGWPGVGQVHLTVTASNHAARDLYASLGFCTYGTEPRSLKLGERYFDEELMVLVLAP